MSDRRNNDFDNYQRALFREVTEDTEKEQFILFWRKHGWQVAAVIAVVLVAVFTVVGYGLYSDWKTEQNAVAYADALNKSLYQPEQAREAFRRLSEEASDGYALLARVQTAALALNDGREEDAFKELKAIGDDEAVPGPFRHLSHIVLAYHLLDKKDRQQEIDELLLPLAGDKSLWRGAAREILALGELGNGNRAKAAELLEQNRTDANLPSSFHIRAGEMLSGMSQVKP